MKLAFFLLMGALAGAAMRLLAHIVFGALAALVIAGFMIGAIVGVGWLMTTFGPGAGICLVVMVAGGACGAVVYFDLG